jgi:MOSC domain-containing protein YiiM
MATLLAACVVAELRKDPGSVGVTAIDKRPVDGPVRIGLFGLYGDVQADRKDHGGLDQAVYAYSQEDAEYWARELGRDIPHGSFGENLRIDGLDVMSSRVGERWSIGSAVLEVTRPRTPCQTFARWLGGDVERGWVRRFAEVRRVGTYLRVVEKGRVTAGDEVVVLASPANAPTVREIYPGA